MPGDRAIWESVPITRPPTSNATSVALAPRGAMCHLAGHSLGAGSSPRFRPERAYDRAVAPAGDLVLGLQPHRLRHGEVRRARTDLDLELVNLGAGGAFQLIEMTSEPKPPRGQRRKPTTCCAGGCQVLAARGTDGLCRRHWERRRRANGTSQLAPVPIKATALADPPGSCASSSSCSGPAAGRSGRPGRPPREELWTARTCRRRSSGGASGASSGRSGGRPTAGRRGRRASGRR